MFIILLFEYCHIVIVVYSTPDEKRGVNAAAAEANDSSKSVA